MGKQTHPREQIAKLQRWKAHPEWGTGEAARVLQVKKPTLLGWKRKYWAQLDSDPDPGERMRAVGGGRKHKMASYEWSVIEFYDTHLRENGTVTKEDVADYCSRIEEFAVLKPSTQRSWLSRFMTRYKPNQQSGNATANEQTPEPNRVGVNGLEEVRTDDGNSDEVVTVVEEGGADRGTAEAAAQKCAATLSSVKPDQLNEFEEIDEARQNEDGELAAAEDTCVIEIDDDSSDPMNDNGKLARSYGMRRRPNANIAVTQLVVSPSNSQTASVSIPLFDDDVRSVEDGNWLTSAAVDYCIAKHFEKDEATVHSATSACFFEISRAYETRDTRMSSFHDATGPFDWDAYVYILLPVLMDRHWSFVVIEKPLSSEQSIFYHVSSLTRVDDTDHIFSVLEWFFSSMKKFLRPAVDVTVTTTYEYTTKPRQSNSVDCGIYMLHYLHAVHKYAIKHKPTTLLDSMPRLTAGKFNVARAAASRAAILKQLKQEIEPHSKT